MEGHDDGPHDVVPQLEGVDHHVDWLRRLDDALRVERVVVRPVRAGDARPLVVPVDLGKYRERDSVKDAILRDEDTFRHVIKCKTHFSFNQLTWLFRVMAFQPSRVLSATRSIFEM